MGKGSADSSGMMAALIAAGSADKAYALAEQQFQWSQQVWQQQQPLVTESTQAQIDLANAELQNMQDAATRAQQQWQTYQTTFVPVEQKFATQASDWGSLGNQALMRGQAMGDVAQAGNAGINAAAEQLRSYGINPGAPRYSGLYASAQPQLAAAEAGAGTKAGQDVKMQQLQLESDAVNAGLGIGNSSTGLTSAATGAGAAGASAASGAASSGYQNLTGTGVGAGASSELFNAGTNAMNSYVGAVNGYNNSQAQYAQAGAEEIAGLGQAAGTLTGLGLYGRVSDEREKTDIKKVGHEPSGLPLYAYRYKDDPKSYPKVVGPMAQDVEKFAPELVREIPGSGGKKLLMFNFGGPTDPQYTPTQGGGATGIPSAPAMPAMAPPGQPGMFGATTGGSVPVHASPSHGAAVDDVPAQLTAGEFVIPKDVAMWVGHKALVGHIDKARREQEQFANRDDIGGEPTMAIPQSPTFVSRRA